jgi:tetratricopeptide (TPR) repeat protein
VLLLRASVYQEKDDAEKALADVDQVLKAHPDLPIAMRFRASILAQSGKFDLAARQLEELQKSEPADLEVELQLGLFYSAEKQYKKAIEKFQAVLEKQPENAVALRGRGDVLLSLGRQAEAIADYEKAIKIDPDDTGVLNNLAWVLATSPDEKLRNGKRAIELATKACELTEYKKPHILSTLAAGYAETGDFNTALKWSQKAVDTGDEDQIEALKKELESYKAGKPVREILNEPEEPQAPAAEKPEAKKPAPEKPEAKKPETEKPQAEKPQAEKSEAEHAEKPKPEEPAKGEPEPKQP